MCPSDKVPGRYETWEWDGTSQSWDKWKVSHCWVEPSSTFCSIGDMTVQIIKIIIKISEK